MGFSDWRRLFLAASQLVELRGKRGKEAELSMVYQLKLIDSLKWLAALIGCRAQRLVPLVIVWLRPRAVCLGAGTWWFAEKGLLVCFCLFVFVTVFFFSTLCMLCPDV